MKPPRTRFASSPEGKIAYQVVGDGPIDLVFTSSGPTQLDMIWENPVLERFLRRLSSFSRLVLINPRGVSLSDPVSLQQPPTLEEWNTDFWRVLTEVRSERACFFATGDVGVFNILAAATNPESVQALVLLNCWATLQSKPEYPYGYADAQLQRINQVVVSTWGSGEILRYGAPELAGDEHLREWYGKFERASASPGMIALMRRTLADVDVRGALAAVRASTLVISHAGDPYVRPGHGRYLAEHIAGARYVERPGFFGMYWAHDVDWVLDEVQSFFTGTRGASAVDDRVLATVMFTDIVGSTQRAAELGDDRWRRVMDDHDALARREIGRFRGRLVKSTGDGLLATFDGPARATRCALALSDAVKALDIEIRAGVHTGEIEFRDGDVHGIAVHIAQRVMSAAAAGEVLASGSVPPLVVGSGIEFGDRGIRALKGIPGEWRIFAVKCA